MKIEKSQFLKDEKNSEGKKLELVHTNVQGKASVPLLEAHCML